MVLREMKSVNPVTRGFTPEKLLCRLLTQLHLRYPRMGDNLGHPSQRERRSKMAVAAYDTHTYDSGRIYNEIPCSNRNQWTRFVYSTLTNLSDILLSEKGIRSMALY